MVGSDDVIDAVLRTLGVSRVDSVDEMLEQLAVFHSPRLPRGPGVATIIVSGGAAGLLSDLAAQCGVSFPALPEATASALRDVVPEFGSVGNPLDVTGQAVFQTDILERSLDLLAEAPNIDVVVYGRGFPSRLDRATPVGRILEGAIERHPDKVFLAMSLVGGHFHPSPIVDTVPAEPITRLGETPFLQSSEYGLKAIAALIRYADFLRSRSPAPPVSAGAESLDGPLTEREAKAILARYGIPVTRERLATSISDAVAAADEIGYPVALKVESPTLLHKTDAGAVELNLADAAAVERGFARLSALNVADMRGILVQEMVPSGTEVILGMTRDPQFGPVIAVGLGGIFVELLQDVQLLIPPVSTADAQRALEQLRGVRVLHGARGRPPGDIRALLDAIVKFSTLCLDYADAVDEIDINPLIVLPNGVKAVDCLIVPSTKEVRIQDGVA
jgi:acetyltransferase